MPRSSVASLLAIGCAMLVIVGSGARAQRSDPGQACLGGTELDERLRVTRRLVTSSDPDDARAREFRRLPAVADSSVQPVSSDAICAAARDAYDAELPITDRLPGRRVYVIRVGDRYVVEDPTFRVGEFGLVMVLDARFAVLSRSMS